MKVLHKFLINVIYGIKKVMHFIFAKRDYSIDDIYIEYFVDHSKDFSIETTEHPLWVRQSYEIEPTTDSYVIDEKDLERAGLSIGDPIPTLPEAVTKILIRISYWYGNRMYKFLTYNNEYTWPPKKANTMSFHIPLTSAQLLDCDDKPVKDVLEKIRRYAGPNSDFYGEKVMIKDMLFYNEDRLKNEVPRIKLKNCFGMMKTVDTLTGLMTDLRLP
tara:strand:- start:5436 stop:6083 length:648 start_codon:yes stop_codon:yes gene_type:complete